MKRMALLTASLLLAIPVLAAQDKPAQRKETPKPATAQAAAVPSPEPTKLAVEAPAAGDSPLVALAKRLPKSPKKGSIVITNATLGGKNAKVTTTASQRPLAVAAPSEDSAPADQIVAALNATSKSKEAATAADKKPLTEAEKARRMNALQQRLDDGYLADDQEGDPARIEHQLEQSAQGKTQTQTAPPPKKP